ncbi:MAG: DMT family transporter [Clostridia bacterium]
MKFHAYGSKSGERRIRWSIATALLAALLYGINAPFSKMLLSEIPPALMAAMLYLGAGIGMTLITVVLPKDKRKREAGMTRRDMPFIAGMILLDIAAPILLMTGLSMTTAGNASLLNNFEIVSTSLIALIIFKEEIGRRTWIAIVLITIGSIILSISDFGALSFSTGSLLVLAACVCWGFENNITRVLSNKNPMHVVVIKGLGSGSGALIIAFFLKEYSNNIIFLLLALLLGFIAYGLSIFLYIKAQRVLGAARTSAYYAAAPFIGVLASWIVLGEGITASFLAAAVLMIAGTLTAVSERHLHAHKHGEETHEHMHGHDDGHHSHRHYDDGDPDCRHSHEHTHEMTDHTHLHTPDSHHRHTHNK